MNAFAEEALGQCPVALQEQLGNHLVAHRTRYADTGFWYMPDFREQSVDGNASRHGGQPHKQGGFLEPVAPLHAESGSPGANPAADCSTGAAMQVRPCRGTGITGGWHSS